MLRTGRPACSAAWLCLSAVPDASHVNEHQVGMQAVAGHIRYVLTGQRERDNNACVLCLMSHVNEYEDVTRQ